MIEDRTIANIARRGLCTGCATCVPLCPYQAISLIRDESKGIYRPVVDTSRCNKCGICLDICPGHSVDFNNLNLAVFGQENTDILLGNYINCYTGYSTDYTVRNNSTSGGLITSLLVYALEEGIINGALVTKMNKKYPLESQPFIARNRDDVISAATSKYCPVPANIALNEILETEGHYAVVGLPCHLHGIRKAEMINEKLKERITLHIGLFCGSTKSFLGTQFQLHRMGIKPKEVNDIVYRSEGWPGSMIIQLRNGQNRHSGLYDYYDIQFTSFIPWRCTVCIDLASEMADISCGDAWLSGKAYENMGTSIIISRRRIVDEILQEMRRKARIELTQTDNDRVLKSQAGFLDKKRDSVARLNISKFCGKRIPIYNNKLLAPSIYGSYFSGGLIYYSRTLLASKRQLWRLLNVYCSLIRYGARLRSRLTLLFKLFLLKINKFR